MVNLPNVNLQVVQGGFPKKYGPKTRKHPWSISYKTLGHFKIIFFLNNGKSVFFTFLSTETLQKKLNSNHIALY